MGVRQPLKIPDQMLADTEGLSCEVFFLTLLELTIFKQLRTSKGWKLWCLISFSTTKIRRTRL